MTAHPGTGTTPATPPGSRAGEDVPAPAGGVVLVEVTGDVDLTTAADLRDRLDVAGRSPTGRVVVDVSGVDFIDCHGLGVLLAARTRMGARLELQAPAPAAANLLDLTGTRHHFDTPPAAPAPPEPGPAGTATTASWPQEVLGAAAETVEHLQLTYPAQVWLVTRVEGDHHVVTAAAGPWAGELPAGTVLPWRGPLDPSDDLDTSTWPMTDVEELLGTGTTGRRLAVCASTGVLLLTGEDVAGTLCGFTTHTTPAPPPETTTALLHLLGRLLGLTLTSARAQAVAQDLAVVDALTGLRNRRGWQQDLARENDRCSRYGTFAGVLAVDLDDLKTTNDTLGHHAGDALLAATAQILRSTCRPSDVLARVGGDEFTVLAAGADPAAVATLTARVEEHLHAAGIPASVAGTARQPTEGLDETWARADEQMYAVKNQRRAHPTTSHAPPHQHTPATSVRLFLHQHGLLPTPGRPTGDPQAGRDDSTASRLDFIHQARQAGLTPPQIRAALTLRHSPTTTSQQLQDLLHVETPPTPEVPT
ncbi:diguanylate cyclase [Pseudokineococcus marinus]|uniref:Diguanylate cyclase n=1 Tax=Pseudokineococcus marinus TaxID=351215 RepID=A0A849BFK5_9ACTN|nr:diguanylate cyclase [Pseudokineococcus marinus]NNH21849.1 diguanylate cyclase [Pseudokineococcus marinus]